jgi:hypothetical protein
MSCHHEIIRRKKVGDEMQTWCSIYEHRLFRPVELKLTIQGKKLAKGVSITLPKREK